MKVCVHDTALLCGCMVRQITVWQAEEDVGRAHAFTHSLLI